MFLDLGPGKTYRVFTNEGQAKQSGDAFRQARDDCISTPSVATVIAGKLRENNRCRNVWILKVNYATGKFFQLSKAGHDKSFQKEVCDTKDVGAIKRSIRALLVAYQKGVTDSQWFFDRAESRPVQFINIHRNRRIAPGKYLPGSDILKEVAEGINRDCLATDQQYRISYVNDGGEVVVDLESKPLSELEQCSKPAVHSLGLIPLAPMGGGSSPTIFKNRRGSRENPQANENLL